MNRIGYCADINSIHYGTDQSPVFHEYNRLQKPPWLCFTISFLDPESISIPEMAGIFPVVFLIFDDFTRPFVIG